MEENVTITLAEYRALVEDRWMLTTILRTLYKGPKLNYGGDGLIYDDSQINAVLGVVDPVVFNKAVTELKLREEEKRNVGKTGSGEMA